MRASNDYVPVRRHDIEIGKPLKWSIFDREHKLLMSAGQVVRNDQQLERLTVDGACRTLISSHGPSDGTAALQRSVRAQRAAERRDEASSDADEPSTAFEPPPDPKRVGFAELRLPIGTQVQMGELEGAGENFRVRYLGMFDGDSVLVTSPVLNNRALAPVREGQRFQVRSFQGKAVYVFDAGVLRVCMAPYPYLHLQYPQRVQVIGLRQAERIRVELPASVEIDGREGNYAWRVVDISVQGVQLVAEDGSAQIDDNVTVTVNLPIAEQATDVCLCGVIRAIRPMVGGTAYGVQLTELDARSRLLVQNFVYRQLLGM